MYVLEYRICCSDTTTAVMAGEQLQHLTSGIVMETAATADAAGEKQTLTQQSLATTSGEYVMGNVETASEGLTPTQVLC